VTEPYDSTVGTREHINKVRFYLRQTMSELDRRAAHHDASKLKSPEKEAFDVLTPRLAELTYGSDEYRASLREMKPAIQHHYAKNTHHPEHYAFFGDGEWTEISDREVKNGTSVSRMSLLDVLEMLMDWKAASERHVDGDIHTSIEHNIERFGISDQLANILRVTAREMGW
jgi:hypothetical protein